MLVTPSNPNHLYKKLSIHKQQDSQRRQRAPSASLTQPQYLSQDNWSYRNTDFRGENKKHIRLQCWAFSVLFLYPVLPSKCIYSIYYFNCSAVISLIPAIKYMWMDNYFFKIPHEFITSLCCLIILPTRCWFAIWKTYTTPLRNKCIQEDSHELTAQPTFINKLWNFTLSILHYKCTGITKRQKTWFENTVLMLWNTFCICS